MNLCVSLPATIAYLESYKWTLACLCESLISSIVIYFYCLVCNCLCTICTNKSAPDVGIGASSFRGFASKIVHILSYCSQKNRCCLYATYRSSSFSLLSSNRASCSLSQSCVIFWFRRGIRGILRGGEIGDSDGDIGSIS